MQTIRQEPLTGTPVRIAGEVTGDTPLATALGSMCVAVARGRRYFGLVEEFAVKVDPVSYPGRERVYVSFRVIDDRHVMPYLLRCEVGWRVGTLTA